MRDRERAERELDRELRAYIDLLTQEKIRAGMSPAAARRAALIESGGVEHVKEQVRDIRAGATLETYVQDLRYAARTLRNSPTFTLIAVLTLAVGIGANTAIFSAVDGVLLKPLPFSEPPRLVSVYQVNRRNGDAREDVAPGTFNDWRTNSSAFAALAAAEPHSLTHPTPEGTELIGNWQVTEDFFAVLDARPVLGRLLQREDYEPGQPRAVVLSYESWQRRYGGAHDVVGRWEQLGGQPAIIVGVLPRRFSYLGTLRRYEIFTPKILSAPELEHRESGWWHVVGRLRPDVTLAEADASLKRLAAHLEREYPRSNAGISAAVVPLRRGIVGESGRPLLLLMGAVAFVLLIACTNVANLMLSRTARRMREFAVRVALGAGPRRIARQVLTESLLLALVGGAAGTVVAYWSVAAIRSLTPARFPRMEEMHVDLRALGFTLATVAVATLLFGVLPAIRAAQPGSPEGLSAGARSVGGSVSSRLRALLMTAEIALAVVLLVGAGLLMRSFLSVTNQERGYASDQVLTGAAFIWQARPTAGARADFVARVTQRLARVPGVEAVGATTSLPLADAIGADEATFAIVGRATVPGEEPKSHVTALTPGAFAALRMQLRAGRLFTSADDSAGTRVTIVSEAMARRFFPHENPIGKQIRFGFYGAPSTREIVGIVADIRQGALDAPAEPVVYLPHAQAATGGIFFVLRTTAEPRTFVRQLKAAVAELDPAIPVTAIRTLDDIVDGSLEARRFTLFLLVSFALASLLLAVVGAYGVINQWTVERSREFAVRLALGAQRADVIAMVVGQGVKTACVGIVIGLAAAAALTRIVSGMLFGITPLDLTTYLGVAALMLFTSLAASYVPAHRATRTSAVSALRA